MMQTLQSWFRPPQFADERQTHQAALLNAIIWGIIFISLPYAVYLVLSPGPVAYELLLQAAGGLVLDLCTLLLLKRGHVRFAGLFQIGTFWIIFTVAAYTGAGVNGSAYLLGYGALIILSGVLFETRGALFMTALVLASGALMVFVEARGWAAFSPPKPPLFTWLISLIVFSINAMIQHIAARAIREATGRAAASEVQYRQLFEAAPNGICIVDMEDRIVMVNPALCEMLGYTQAEAIGRSITDFMDSAEAIQKPPRPVKTLHSLGPIRRERVLRHKDGMLIYTMVASQAVPSGHYQYIVQDITEHKLAEQFSLRRETILEAVTFAAEEFLKTPNWRDNIEAVMARLGEELRISHVYFFEHHTLPDGTLVGSMRYEWAASGQVNEMDDPEFQNTPLLEEGFERQYEILSRGDVFVGSADTFTPVEKAYQEKIGIKALLEVPIMINGVWWGTLGFDDYVHARTWTPAEVGALKIAGSVISAAIQRQQVDAAVREAERIYRQAIESAGAVPYYLDYAAEAYRFIGAGIKQMTGYSASEINLAVWRSMIVKAQMQGETAQLTYEEALQKSERGELSIWHCDNYLRTRSGELRWINDSAIEVFEHGQAVGMIGILQDITERKQNEALLTATTFAAEQFLKSPQWRDNIQAVLERMGLAINASHAYLFENHLGPHGEEVTSIRYEWTAPGFDSDLDADDFHNLPLHEEGFVRWYEAMTQGKAVISDARTLSISEKEFLSGRGIHAMLDTPIYVNGKWWGIIGFDEMAREHEWLETEVEALRVAANVLGAAIEREQVDAAFREAELRFRTLVEQIPAITYIDTADATGNTIYISPQVETMLGITAEEWETGQIDFWVDLIAPEHRAAVRQAYIHSSMTGEPFDMEYRLMRRDGRDLWVHDRAVVLRAADGRPLWIHGVIFDITERRKANEALHQYAARFEILHQIDRALRSEQATAAIAGTAAHNLRTLLQCDRVSVTLFDFSQEKVYYVAVSAAADSNYIEAGATVTLDDFGRYMLESLRNNQTYVVADLNDMQNKTPTDQLSYESGMHSWLYVPLHAQNELIGSLNLGSRHPNAFSTEQGEIAREVANQLAIAIQQSKLFETIQNMNANLESMVIQRTTELETANKELSAFSYSVSHDLRAPLRAIRSYSQILKKDYGDLIPAEGQAYLDHVMEGAQQMNDLIEALLALARTTRGDLRKVHLDLSALAREILNGFQQHEPERAVTYTVADDLVARADEKLLSTVLQNLLGNAWKYTSRTPAATIAFGAEQRESETVYFVRDNGVGFDMKYRDKLFGPFQRLHSAEEFSGHGIGLASVQRIIQRHGGRVWAEGEPDKGATFYFTLG